MGYNQEIFARGRILPGADLEAAHRVVLPPGVDLEAAHRVVLRRQAIASGSPQRVCLRHDMTSFHFVPFSMTATKFYSIYKGSYLKLQKKPSKRHTAINTVTNTTYDLFSIFPLFKISQYKKILILFSFSPIIIL
jgi:hypothetical protein